MKKQYVKELKQILQLPGKFSIALENLLGQSEKFFHSINNNYLNALNNVVNSYCQVGTVPIYAVK